MPKNPSELARLEAELEFLKLGLKTGFNSKSTKEYLLREIRKLEGQLGIASNPYNAGEF